MDINFPIYHVLVVGFHHKRGCQVEYSFPPLETELENTAWRHLPTLAMPDGAHNFDRDTVYFHLPSLVNPRETVFGVACYQQIDACKLKRKPDDVTRSTVQKSVCVLSRYPLYGHIQVKMALITAAYFREGDFAQVALLEEAYYNLNACLTADLLDTPETFVGLSPRDLVFTFRHQILILFKLLLLEKKVLFRGPSVGKMCSALLTLVSLLPLSVEYGLQESACVRTAKSLSVVPQFSRDSSGEDETSSSKSVVGPTVSQNEASNGRDHKDRTSPSKPQEDIKSGDSVYPEYSSAAQIIAEDDLSLSIKKSLSNDGDKSLTDSDSTLDKCEDVPDFFTAVQIKPSEAGLPLSLFSNGFLCHPYLSLNYLELLMDTRVRGFIVGATNILFKQKKDLVDIIVEMQDGSIDIQCPNLKRILTLTTQDLRFAENIVKQVTQEGSRNYDGDSFMDGVGWEGGDEWIRAQFKYYLMCMMRTSLVEDLNRQRDCFNRQYLQSWQSTHHWATWKKYVNSDERDTPGIYSICPGHPNEGNISMSDMRIKLSHAMHNSEGGRRFNQAVANTGRAVAQTGKAFGGAIFQAKGAFTNWWGQVTTPTGTAPTFPPSPMVPGSDNSNVKTSSDSSNNLSQSTFHIENID